MKADGRPPVGSGPIRSVWRVRTDPQRCLDDPIHGEDGAHEPTDPIDRAHVHIALTIGLLCHEALIHAGARLLSVGLRQTPRAPAIAHWASSGSVVDELPPKRLPLAMGFFERQLVCSLVLHGGLTRQLRRWGSEVDSLTTKDQRGLRLSGVPNFITPQGL